MSLRFHEIAESNHRILNPLTEEKLMLIGEICHLTPGMLQLDLACGKGEMLCRWSDRYGIQGTGVDISKVFLEAARKRAQELQVDGRVSFVEDDGAAYLRRINEPSFDVVSCIGATWIGDGLEGTLQLMKNTLKPEGLLLVGEPYWQETPDDEIYRTADIEPGMFTSLIGTLDRIENQGFELVEMVLASPDSWDRYEASQWWSASEWLRDNPDDPEHEKFHEWISNNRRTYLRYLRQYLNWGVFILKIQQTDVSGIA